MMCLHGVLVHGQCNDVILPIEGESAELFCNIDTLSCLSFELSEPTQPAQLMVSFKSDDNNSCGGSIENSRWFSFVAWTPVTEILFTYENCERSLTYNSPQQFGAQLMIFDMPVNWDTEVTPLTFNCNCNNTTPGITYDSTGPNSYDLETDSLEIGKQYWVMIDGCSGNLCDVTIEFKNLPDTDPLTGTADLPEITNDLLTNPVCDEPRVCADTNFEISWPDHDETGGLSYEISIFDDNHMAIETMVTDSSRLEWMASAPGNYSYEVEFSNICDDTNPIFSNDFIVEEPDTIVMVSDTICSGEAQGYIGWPTHWLGRGCNYSIIPTQELYECSYIDDCNCRVVEQKSIHVLPLIPISNIDTVLCGDAESAFPFFYHGYLFNDENPDGQDILVLGGSDGFGCDSLINVKVFAPNVEASLSLVGCDGLEVTYEVMLDQYPDYIDPNMIRIDWFENGTLLHSGDTYVAFIDSVLDVEVSWSYLTSTNSADCSKDVVLGQTYLNSSFADYTYPEVSCRTSNDTVFYDFSFVPEPPSLVQITQLTSYSNEWDGNTWIFPNVQSTDEVSILLSATDGNCSVPDLGPVTCSSQCNTYSIMLPQNNLNTICLHNGPESIVLEAIVAPTPSVNAVTNWIDRDALPISQPFLPVDGIDSTYLITYQIQEPGCPLQEVEMQMSFAFPLALELVTPEVYVCQGGLVNTDTIFTFEEGMTGFLSSSSQIDFDIDGGLSSIFSIGGGISGQHEVFINAGTVDCPSTVLRSFIVNVESQEVLNIQCLDSGYPIQFTWDDIVCFDSYDVYVDDVFIKNQENVTYTPLGFDQGIDIKLEIVPQSSCQCEYDSIVLSCNTGDCPPLVTSLDWEEQTFCVDEVPVSLINTITLVASGVSETSTTPITNTLGRTEYIQTIETPNQCVYSDTFYVSIVAIPSVDIEGYSSDCYDDPLGGVTVDLDETQLLPEVLIEGEVYMIADLTTTDFEEGDYVVDFTSIDGCDISGFFTIPQTPIDFSIGIIGSDIVDEGTSTTYALESNVTDWTLIEWYVDGELICEDSFNCSVDNMGSGPGRVVITAYIYTSPDCFKSFDYEVVINEVIPLEKLEDIFIPNTFMPSQGGKDATWVIGANIPMEVLLIKIYDRWGNEVYSTEEIIVDGEHSLWDGTFAGRHVETGVYIYMVQYLDELGISHVVSGDLTLIR